MAHTREQIWFLQDHLPQGAASTLETTVLIMEMICPACEVLLS